VQFAADTTTEFAVRPQPSSMTHPTNVAFTTLPDDVPMRKSIVFEWMTLSRKRTSRSQKITPGRQSSDLHVTFTIMTQRPSKCSRLTDRERQLRRRSLISRQ
jgi:hypothetical protein